MVTELRTDGSAGWESLAGRYADPEALWAALDSIHRAYLLQILNPLAPVPDEQSARDILLDTALAIESLATGELRARGRSVEVERALALAAQLFEYLGDLQQEQLDVVRELNLYVHASVCYRLAHYEASSVVLADRLYEKVDDLAAKTNEDSYERFLLDFDRAVLAFLGRDVHRARELAEGVVAAISDRAGFLRRHAEARELIARAELLRFIDAFASFLLTGTWQQRDEGLDRVQRVRSLLAEGDGAFLYWLAARLELVARGMEERSIWTVLGEMAIRRPEYLSALAKHTPPIVELWTSQVRALQGGKGQPGLLGSERGAVIVMPTSTGKTRVAEIAIADALDPNGTETAIYIVPTRALVAQVEGKLANTLGPAGYPVATSTGAYEVIPGLEEVLLSNVRVLVTTPEKLDLLARRGDPVVASARLFIIDEGDKIDDDERGLRLEFLIRRLRRTYGPLGARFVLLSAVLPRSNFDQFANWLEGDVSAINWRPTRLLEGVFSWRPRYMYRKGKRLYRHLEGDVHYLGRFSLPGLLPGTEKLGTKEPWPKRADIVAELATAYAAALPPVLLFCLTKPMAEAAAARVVGNIRERPGGTHAWLARVGHPRRQRLDELARLVEQRFGVDAPLAGAVRLGVAYHHASLPDDLRLAIERALTRGDLDVLAATSTLAEGIDTPVRVVLFGATVIKMRNARTGSEDELRLTARDFRNIAGRAGRALSETEGHAILVDPSPRERTLLTADALEENPVLSNCFRLAEWLGLEARTRGLEPDAWLAAEEQVEITGEGAGELRLVQRAFQSAIFAETTQGHVPEQPVANTLYVEQVDQQNPKEVAEMKALAAYGRQQGYRILGRELNPELASIFNQSGFSLESCELLDNRVRTLVEESDPTRWTVVREGGELLVTSYADLIALALLPDEVQPQQREDATPVDPDHTVAVITDWVRGVEVRDLLMTHFDIGTAAKQRKAVTFLYGVIVQLIPWALSTATRLLKYHLDERSLPLTAELLLMPGYIKQGVDHPVALLATTLGQLDRRIAREVVAPQYPGPMPFGGNGEGPSWQEFWEEARGWFASLEDEEIERWIEAPRTWEAIRDAVGRSRMHLKGWRLFLRCPLAGLQYAAGEQVLAELARGERLLLQREPDNPSDRHAVRVLGADGAQLGYVPARFAPWIARMLDQGVPIRTEVAVILGPDQLISRRVQLALWRLFP
jgi:helicase